MPSIEEVPRGRRTEGRATSALTGCHWQKNDQLLADPLPKSRCDGPVIVTSVQSDTGDTAPRPECRRTGIGGSTSAVALVKRPECISALESRCPRHCTVTATSAGPVS